MKVGDIVRFTDSNDGNIPYKSIGKVKKVDIDYVDVEFKGIYHKNPYVQSNVWTCWRDNLQVMLEASESSEKPSDNPTLTIPLVKGIEYLRGQFKDSKGNVYNVHVDKVPLIRKK